MNQQNPKKITPEELKRLQDKFPEADENNWQNYCNLNVGKDRDKSDAEKEVRL